jgi:hypothetical protein
VQVASLLGWMLVGWDWDVADDCPVGCDGNWQVLVLFMCQLATRGVRCYRYVGAEELRHSYLPTQNSLTVFMPSTTISLLYSTWILLGAYIIRQLQIMVNLFYNWLPPKGIYL